MIDEVMSSLDKPSWYGDVESLLNDGERHKAIMLIMEHMVGFSSADAEKAIRKGVFDSLDKMNN